MQHLPTDLLYQVTRHLDLHSQRSVFLCSSRLYRRWHLQIADDDSVWQFIRNCLDLVSDPSVCTSGCLCLIPRDFDMETVDWKGGDRIAHTTVKFRPSGKDSSCMVSRWPALPQRSSQWTEMIKERFWHCLTALPKVADALLDISSMDGARYDDLQALGRQFFRLLCINNGTLRFDLHRQAKKPRNPSCSSQLVVTHAMHVEHGVNLSNLWQIDGGGCKVQPPHLHFCRLPRQITAVHISIVGKFDLNPYLTSASFDGYPIKNKAVSEFAYNGNMWM